MADTSTGYILMWRSIRNWQWYTDVPVAHLYQHLLLTANHEDQPWRDVIIRKGSLITSVQKLAVETGLSVQQIRTALKKLQSTNEIEVVATNKYTMINIIKYANFQQPSQFTNKQKTSSATNKQQTSNKQATTNNTLNTLRINNKSSLSVRTRKDEEPHIIDGNTQQNPYAPTLDDVKDFCAVKGLLINPEEFYYRYSGMDWKVSGTPITNWMSLALSWNAEAKKKATTSRPQATHTGSKFADIFAEENTNG